MRCQAFVDPHAARRCLLQMLRDFVQTHAPERLALIRVIHSELSKGARVCVHARARTSMSTSASVSASVAIRHSFEHLQEHRAFLINSHTHTSPLHPTPRMYH